jgi:hypothetical protein
MYTGQVHQLGDRQGDWKRAVPEHPHLRPRHPPHRPPLPRQVSALPLQQRVLKRYVLSFWGIFQRGSY